MAEEQQKPREKYQRNTETVRSRRALEAQSCRMTLQVVEEIRQSNNATIKNAESLQYNSQGTENTLSAHLIVTENEQSPGKNSVQDQAKK